MQFSEYKKGDVLPESLADNPRKKPLSHKVGKGYDNQQLRNAYETTKKHSDAIMRRVKPARSRNPLKGVTPRGTADETNSLRARAKKLSGKIGEEYTSRRLRASYEETKKHSDEILKEKKKSNNPLKEVTPRGVEHEGNSLRMRQKQLSNKIGSNYDKNVAGEHSQSSKHEYEKLRQRATRNTNPLEEKKSDAVATESNSLRMRQKKISGKVGANYDGAKSRKVFLSARKDGRRVIDRVRQNRNPLEETHPEGDKQAQKTGPADTNVNRRNMLSDKVGVGFDLSALKMAHADTMMERNRILNRVKASRNPLSE